MSQLEQFLKNIPINELYKDLFKPGMQKAGEALSTIIDGANLVLLPLKLLNGKSRIYFDKNLENYSNKLNVNNNLTPTQVPQYVGFPVIDKFTYLDQNELSEAFINLLTKASFEETLGHAHPAYISILERLSVDEAKILFHYKDKTRIPFIEIYIHRFIEEVSKPDESVKGKAKLQQLIDYTYQDRKKVYIKAAWNLTGIEKEINLLFPENIDIYIENLEVNGLLTYDRDGHMEEDSDIYEKLISEYYKKTYDDIEEELKSSNSEFKLELEIRKGYIEFSEIGRGFLKACIKEIE